MSFGTGKLPGINSTLKKKLRKMADKQCTPQEISDQLNVKLSCVFSFYQQHLKLSDDEMAEFPVADSSVASDREATARAAEIIANAEARAAEIVAAAGIELNVKDEVPPKSEALPKSVGKKTR